MSDSLGRFVVSDPAVCHGRPTFRATRVFVSDVLDDVARGMAWEAIIERWHGSISKGAIAEAVRLARDALLNHAAELVSRWPAHSAPGCCIDHLPSA
jgi:uncharacterized protein (DUF433 family)